MFPGSIWILNTVGKGALKLTKANERKEGREGGMEEEEERRKSPERKF